MKAELVPLQPSRRALLGNRLFHASLFFLLAAALPTLWFVLPLAPVLVWQWRRAEAHLKLESPNGLRALRHGETGWALADREDRWHEGLLLARHFQSRLFLVLEFRHPQGRRYRQFLTPAMCGEPGYRTLCRAVHLQRREEGALLP